MIKQAKDVPIIAYKPVSSYTRRGNLKLVDLDSLTKSRDIASKAAYETSLMKALENKKFWDELLEKLRKSGSGGGGSRKIDKILTSLMFTNFLSSKLVQAMLKSFNMEFLKSLTDNISKQTNNLTQGTIGKIVQNVTTFTLNVTTALFSNIIKILNLPNAFKYTTSFTNQLTSLVGILSFQLNKLKEILEEELKELITKLDVKEKIRKVREEILNVLEVAKKIFFPQLEQVLHEPHNKKSLNKLKTFPKLKILDV